MLDEIESQFDISVKGIPFVGDSLRDLEAAIAKGCDPVLVRTGRGSTTQEIIRKDEKFNQVSVYDDLSSFVDFYLKEEKRGE